MGEVRDSLLGRGGGWESCIILLEGSKASPTHPSDKGSISEDVRMVGSSCLRQAAAGF
jgi:hypothetical protein